MKSSIFASMVIAAFAASAVADSSDAIENVAALGAAPHVCGFKVNEAMFEVALNANFSDPSDINPGGRHYAELQRNIQRIKDLTASPDGTRSFCARVSQDMSAFLD